MLEQRPAIGGMTRSDHAIAEAPGHLINHCAVDPVFWPNGRAAQDLALYQQGLRWVTVDPAFAYLHPSGESIAFWRDPFQTAEDIRRFSRSDAEAYLELAVLFEAVCDIALPMFAANPTRPGPRRWPRRCALRCATVARWARSAASWPPPDRSRSRSASSTPSSARPCTSPRVASIPSSFPSSTIQLLILAFVHRFACLRPVGGTQALPDALAARLTSRGGRVAVEARVEEITVRGGRATGVALADGRELGARIAVLAACDARQALAELLPPGSMERRLERRAAAIPANGLGWGQLKVDIACSGRLDLSRFEAERIDGADLRAASHLIGTERGLEQGYRRAAAGLLPRRRRDRLLQRDPDGGRPLAGAGGRGHPLPDRRHLAGRARRRMDARAAGARRR